ncbi:MAG TPA: hypothetical protein VKV06_16230 [Acidimicrobiales bacterium]|nr:hypothetical protein [Acidimicrobiales bacterium]
MAAGRISKDEARKVLRRVGVPDDRIEEILDQLPDPVDLDKQAPLLARYGIDRSRLNDRMGGSP